MKNKYLIEKIVLCKKKERLDKFIVTLIPKYSRNKIKRMILNGMVKINNKIVKIAKQKVFFKDFLQIINDFSEQKFDKPQNIFLDIIYEDNFIIIINKQNNIIVHPGNGNKTGTILNALLYYYKPIKYIPRAGIVHRLDKETTGLMIIAKTLTVMNMLIKLIKERKIYREYIAITHGIVKNDGLINKPIGRNFINRTKMSININGKYAITYFNVIKYLFSSTLLKIKIETGRTHQIRVHMSSIGHPILGDKLYNKKKIYKSENNKLNILNNFHRQALHAKYISLIHPITLKFIKFKAPIPEDLLNLIKIISNK